MPAPSDAVSGPPACGRVEVVGVRHVCIPPECEQVNRQSCWIRGHLPAWVMDVRAGAEAAAAEWAAHSMSSRRPVVRGWEQQCV